MNRLRRSDTFSCGLRLVRQMQAWCPTFSDRGSFTLSFQFLMQCNAICHNATESTNMCLPEMKSPFFWNKTPCHWVISARGFVPEKSGTKHSVTRGHGDLNCTASKALKLAYLITVRSEIMYFCYREVNCTEDTSGENLTQRGRLKGLT